MKATKEQIKQWLDTQIGVMYVQSQRLTLTEKSASPYRVLCNYSYQSYIHIGNDALRYVAKEMNLPITVTDKFKDDPDFRYELVFWYNGVKFSALESEKEYEQNGELA